MQLYLIKPKLEMDIKKKKDFLQRMREIKNQDFIERMTIGFCEREEKGKGDKDGQDFWRKGEWGKRGRVRKREKKDERRRERKCVVFPIFF